MLRDFQQNFEENIHYDVTDSMDQSLAGGDSYFTNGSVGSSKSASPSASPKKSALGSPKKSRDVPASNGYNMRQRKVKVSNQ